MLKCNTLSTVIHNSRSRILLARTQRVREISHNTEHVWHSGQARPNEYRTASADVTDTRIYWADNFHYRPAPSDGGFELAERVFVRLPGARSEASWYRRYPRQPSNADIADSRNLIMTRLAGLRLGNESNLLKAAADFC